MVANFELEYGTVAKVDKETMDQQVRPILQHVIGDSAYSIVKKSAAIEQQLLNVLILYIFSHRFNKQDQYLQALKQEVSSQGNYVCFEDIRKMMYNYSKKQQRLFMKNPLLAFLMLCFLTSADALAFIQQTKMFSACPTRRNEFNETKFKKIQEEIEDLKSQAIKAL